MLQKEVAERICAQSKRTNPVRSRPPIETGAATAALRRPTSNGMNLLAAAVQFWADPEIILKLKPSEFGPAPKVDSAIIKLSTKTLATSELETEKYYELIHIIFKQPRKTLINNLKEGLDIPKNELEKALKSLGLPVNCRPKNLTIKKILELIKLINQIS